MAQVVFSCAHVLLGAHEFSSQFTDVIVNRSSESLDVSTMGTGTRKHKGGVKDASVTGKGFVNLGSSLMDGVIFGGVAADATQKSRRP